MKKLMIAAILLVIGLAILDLTYDPGCKADFECPMANRHIEWYYAGK